MDELAKRFADLANHYGPQVADAALGAARVEAYSSLAGATLALVVSALGFYGSYFFYKKVMAETDGYDDNTLFLIPCVLLGVVAAIAGLAGVWSWVDPWTWTAINHPELWLAKQAFKI